MTPEHFVYWLQGFSELGGKSPPTQEQWESIRAHLNLVFEKVTPDVGSKKPEVPKVEKKDVPTPRPNLFPKAPINWPIPGNGPYPDNARGPKLPAIPSIPGDVWPVGLDPNKVTLMC